MIAQAIFIAIHIHGVNCFGVEPLFYDHYDLNINPQKGSTMMKQGIAKEETFCDESSQ